MKTHCIAAAVAASFFAVPFAATAEDEILPQAKRGGYAVFDVWYSDFDTEYFDLDGGGFRIGGEYVDPAWLVGIGGRVGFGIYFGDKEDLGAGERRDDVFAFDLTADAYVPFRVSEFATIYGGVGATGFNESWDAEYTARRGRQAYKATDSWRTKGFPVLFSAFGGIRLRLDNVFAFAEYRKDFEKDVSLEWSEHGRGGSYADAGKAKFGGGRIFLGIGFEFGN